MTWLVHAEALIGKEKVEKLSKSEVLVVGLGGVGAYAAEMLCRAGIGKMTIVDGDEVEPANRNRQLPALISNEGKLKAEIMAERFRDINPEIELKIITEFIKDEEMPKIIGSYDYIVDAIDTLAPKVSLITAALEKKIPLVSSMGAGGRLDPTMIKVADISKSYNDNLARMLRKRLHKTGIRTGFKVVFSSEKVIEESLMIKPGQNKKSSFGTISYLPAVFGCTCASVVIRDLIL